MIKRKDLEISILLPDLMTRFRDVAVDAVKLDPDRTNRVSSNDGETCTVTAGSRLRNETMLKAYAARMSMLIAGLLVSASALAADPTLHEVYQAADAGHYREAQSMMDKVLRDHPNSAKAHFVEAELLARQGRATAAQAELARAEALEPGLPFARPGAVQELKSHIAVPRSPMPAATPYMGQPSRPAIPWGMLLVGAMLLVALYLFLRARNQAVAGGTPAYGGNTINMPPAGSSTGYGMPSYGAAPPPAAGGLGSGILGGLATGAAVGAGVVAGEALMHRMLDGDRHENFRRQDDGFIEPVPQPDIDTNYDMGGNDFGVNDPGSWDDAGDSGSDDWS
jgi:hypothetical protein